MVYIFGVNVLNSKRVCIGLTYIYGIGIKTSIKICKNIGISHLKYVKNLNDIELKKIRKELLNYTIEGDLRKKNIINIKRLIELGCYRGIRHKKNLPVRGQRTRTNAKTRKIHLKKYNKF